MRELSKRDIQQVHGGASGSIDPITGVLLLVTSPISAALIAWSSTGILSYGEALTAIWRSVLSGGRY